MNECKHGLRSGCSYCHIMNTGEAEGLARSADPKKRRGPASRLSEKMNDRMTALKRRLRELRGE
jgi:hypothetical protein